jgi:hypothetical protein
VAGRLPEAYQWLFVPTQASSQNAVEWQAIRLSGQDALAVRASKKLKNDGLVTGFGAVTLRLELDRVPLWRGNHVSIKQLVEDFARYLYLPRLANPAVLVGAIRDGLALLTWERESFAFAEDYDEAAGRYRGLRGGQQVTIPDSDAPGLLVKPDVARRQLDAETPSPGPQPGPTPPAPGATLPTPAVPAVTDKKPRRFHGSVTLEPTRVGRDASKIAEEVIAHVAGLPGAEVCVTLEVEATLPNGAPDHVVRTVTENSRTLRFTSHGFETE